MQYYLTLSCQLSDLNCKHEMAILSLQIKNRSDSRCQNLFIIYQQLTRKGPWLEIDCK